MIIYEEDKKTLIIPTGIGNIDNTIYYDDGFVDGYGSGRTDGFAEGQENVRGKLCDMLFTLDGNFTGITKTFPSDGYEGAKKIDITDNGYGAKKYSDGYGNGFDDGHSSGYTDGYENGFDDGHSSGFTDGYSSGFTDGYSSGFTDGYNSGKTVITEFKFTYWNNIFSYIDVVSMKINGVESPIKGASVWFQGGPSFLALSGETSAKTISSIEYNIHITVDNPSFGFPEEWDSAEINGVTVAIKSQHCEKTVIDETEWWGYYTITFYDEPVYDIASYDAGYAAGLAACQNNENENQ